MARKFKIKNIGGLPYILGIQVARSKVVVFPIGPKTYPGLVQENKYILMQLGDNPIDANHKYGVPSSMSTKNVGCISISFT